ncbi:MAG: hypothetical protein Alis3KO_01220 [Aliiglaciecola sp.]
MNIAEPQFISSRFHYFSLLPEDLTHFTALYCDPGIMLKIMQPLSEQEAKRLFQMVTCHTQIRPAHFFKVVDPKDKATLGVMGFLPQEDHQLHGTTAEFGILLYPEFYGNGTAKEAITTLLTYGFEKLGLDSAYAKYEENNEAIGRIAKFLHFNIDTMASNADKRICRIKKHTFLDNLTRTC